MNHELTLVEQQLLDQLLERYRFTPVAVRLSSTMLSKSIIDARASIQALFKRTGIVDYGAIGQGQEWKVTANLPFVSAIGSGSRRVSFYRPPTKDGDPRFWVERLASTTAAGDAIVLAFSGTDVVVIHLTGTVTELAPHLDALLPSTFEERGELESLVSRLASSLKPMSSQWVTSGRLGPTGVGYTLETLLGINANSSRNPDFKGLELKAYRRGALTGAGKPVTLFSKTPDWRGIAKGKGLLDRFGYWDEDRGRRALYCTITKSPNTLGWKLVVNPGQGEVSVVHRDDVAVSYTLVGLEQCLLSKHPATLFVRASHRRDGAVEQFRYDDVTLCRDPSLPNFLELIDDGLIGLDFTLHLRPDGSSRDHGFLWRIRESAIPRLYAYRRQIT